MPLAGTFWVKSMVRFGKNFYIFDFGGHQHEKWNLVVTNVLDALFVCCLKMGLTQPELILQLVNLVIHFYTLLRLFHPVYQPPPTLVFWQLSGSIFMKADYDAYVKSQ